MLSQELILKVATRKIADTEVGSSRLAKLLCIYLTPQAEQGIDSQKRLIKEFCDTVGDFTPS